jgi:hypothetical protein
MLWRYSSIISDPLASNVGFHCAIVMSAIADPVVKGGPLLVGTMMSAMQIFLKTEPRETVYGILALCDKLEHCEHPWAILLEVDYSISFPAVIRDATRYGMCQAENIRNLSRIYYPFDGF